MTRSRLSLVCFSMIWFGEIRNNFSHRGPLNLGLVQNRHFKNYKYMWHYSKQFLRQGYLQNKSWLAGNKKIRWKQLLLFRFVSLFWFQPENLHIIQKSRFESLGEKCPKFKVTFRVFVRRSLGDYAGAQIFSKLRVEKMFA